MGNRQKKRKKTYTPHHEEYRREDGSYGGLLCRNSAGKWAATWNAVPPDDDPAYCYNMKEGAKLALALRGKPT